jgi:uncharacterized protein with PQ loop repeat
MTTLKHTVGLLSIKSVDQLMETLNSLPNTTCIIESKTISSVSLSIDIDMDITLDDILSLGTLIGSIQTSSLL